MAEAVVVVIFTILRESLSVLLRYHAALNGSLAVMMEEEAGVVVIREEVLVGSAGSVRQPTELAVGVMLLLMRQVLGSGWHPRRVCFQHDPPRDTRTHLRVFGPCVEFNQDFNGIVCSRAELDTANPAADTATRPSTTTVRRSPARASTSNRVPSTTSSPPSVRTRNWRPSCFATAK